MANKRIETVRYTQHATAQTIVGIARLTLCKDCLGHAINKLISERVKTDGTPKIFQKKSLKG